MTSLALFPFEGRWHQVRRCDVRARLLADRHYSRQTPGADEFMSNGRPLVLLTDDERAVWGVLENMSPARGGGATLSLYDLPERRRRALERPHSRGDGADLRLLALALRRIADRAAYDGG